MIDFLNQLDNQIFLFFNSFHNDFFDRVMWILTGKMIWLPLYIALFAVLLRTFKLRTVIVYSVAIALTIALADQICSSVLRPMFERMRPSNPDNPISSMVHIVNGYHGGSYGFPSCHAANSFALATIITLMLRSRLAGILLFSWALLNSYTRIYLGVHYPGDILVGASVGSTIAFCCYHAARYIERRQLKSAAQKLQKPLYHSSFSLPLFGASATVPLHLTLLGAVATVFSLIIFISVVVSI